MTIQARRILVPAAVAFAIAAPILQSLLDLGLSAAAFAAAGDQTLRAAGYAFSIWSLIYTGLVAYAVWQALPRNRDNPRLAVVGWPSVVAIGGCGLWICASALDLRWASVAIILVSAAVLIWGLVVLRARPEPASVGERVFVHWPLGLLAGWLTIATAINFLTVATADRLIPPGDPTAGLLGVAAVGAATAGVLLRVRLAPYPLPVIWGLVAVWVAERAGKPDVALTALGVGAALSVLTLVVVGVNARRR